jgi:hypothetical protein
MREALVLRGGPTWPKNWIVMAPVWGIDGWVWETHDKNGNPNTELVVTPATASQPIVTKMDMMRTHGFQNRLMTDPKWWNHTLSPVQLAAKMSQTLTDLGQNGKQCSLMPDIEPKDPDFVLATLVELQRIRPGRGIVWTLEGNQAGPGSWLANARHLIDYINSRPLIRVAPQAYDANEDPWSADEMRVQMWDAGFARDKVEVFYSFKQQFGSPRRWSGIQFDWASRV